MRPLVFCIVGRSKTGKTTLIERMIPYLTSKGIVVATIKHHHEPFEMDVEGKDTYRHKKAGARAAMIVSEKRLGLVKDMEEEMGVRELVARYMNDVDLVIVEGYKKASLPKIEVYSHREEGPVAEGDERLMAIVADRPMDAPVPVFMRDDVEAIAGFVMETLGLGSQKRERHNDIP
jgi:molybdopterin-guanine dinucleotide biosynthesis protein B